MDEHMHVRTDSSLPPAEELLIVELDERVEFSSIPLDADTEANNGCQNTTSCSGENMNCSNGTSCS
jgi:hypothetical protein